MNNMVLNKTRKVFVAMSGGVDSSVAAAILKGQGYDAVGVTMCFSISHPDTKRPSCCGFDGIQDAKRAAQILDIPHYVLDFSKDLQQDIIENFVDEYLKGRTPNPCVRCNQFLKFGTLLNKVKGLGADYLATGHYARIERSEHTGCFELKKAVDDRKDQSYFLYGMNRDFLPVVLFPLGGLRKDQVRELAQRFHLNTAAKPESQDICFVPDSGYKKFIEDRVGAQASLPGEFVDEDGRVIGEHRGIAYYTIGQRENLGLALGERVYVYKIDPQANRVYVGSPDKLYASGLSAARLNWLGEEKNLERREVAARIRYNAPEVKGILSFREQGDVRVEFVDPQKAVTPGQSVVFYDNDIVLGGAVIEQPLYLKGTRSHEHHIG